MPLARYGRLPGCGRRQKQVEGIDTILDKWEAQGLTDLRWLAYMLATAYHETAATMQPIEERGKGKGYKGKISNGQAPSMTFPATLSITTAVDMCN